MAALAPLSSTCAQKTWNGCVYQYDASLRGYRIVRAEAPPDLVARVARCKERYRFTGPLRVSGAPRESVALGDIPGPMHALLEDVSDAKIAELDTAQVLDYGLANRFSELPRSLIEGRLWHVVFGGRWHHSSHITSLETATRCLLARRLARSRKNHNTHTLAVGDNLGTVLSSCKGRSGKWALMQHLRRASAFSLAANITLRDR